jgi:hypothetical protein
MRMKKSDSIPAANLYHIFAYILVTSAEFNAVEYIKKNCFLSKGDILKLINSF